MLDRLFSQETMLFTIPALLGTGVFLLKMALMALGGFGADIDADADVDVDVDADGSDSTDAFTLLSIQSMMLEKSAFAARQFVPKAAALRAVHETIFSASSSVMPR